MNHVFRDVLAILMGAISTVVLVVMGSVVAIVALLDPGPGDLVPYATPAFLAVSLGFSFPSALVGGWLATRIGRRNSIVHSTGVGILLLLPIALSRGTPGPGQPNWYPWTFGAVIIAGASLGGSLYRRIGSGGSK